MKKILFTKLNNSLSQQLTAVVQNDNENSNKNLYLERKNMQTAYQELFKALLKLPDRQVQARVLDAINEKSNRLKPIDIIATCDLCKQRTKKNLVNVATQTTATGTDFESNTSFIASSNDDSADMVLTVKGKTNINESTEPNRNEAKKLIKKQRRKVRVPKVIKKSQTEQQKHQPILQKRKSQTLKSSNEVPKMQDEEAPISKRQRSESLSSTDLNDALFYTSVLESAEDEQTIIKKIMMREYFQAEVVTDGLIPIHTAIMNNDLFGLKRQILVWRNLKKVDLNELCTDDDEDCLQLAVIQNKSNCIVQTLVQNGWNLNSLDMQYNTLIHLAVLNNVDVEVLNTLMGKIDLNMLLKLNDDGLTALHLAIRQENFILAEAILNSIDRRSIAQLSYQRGTADTKDDFLNFYEKQCENLASKGNSIFKENKNKLRLKQQFIDAADMRSGNTALFNAIENKFEHLIYLLLAHFADPGIENHSGQSARAYLGEFAKTLNLSLKIDRAMEQVECFLHK